MIIKDSSELFKNIPKGNYDRVMLRLYRMRAAHPEYRDEQLLMYMLCEDDLGQSRD